MCVWYDLCFSHMTLFTIIGSFWWTVSKLRGAREGFRLKKMGSSFLTMRPDMKEEETCSGCVFICSLMFICSPHLSCWTSIARFTSSPELQHRWRRFFCWYRDSFSPDNMFLTALITLMWPQLLDSYLHVHVNQKVRHIVNEDSPKSQCVT